MGTQYWLSTRWKKSGKQRKKSWDHIKNICLTGWGFWGDKVHPSRKGREPIRWCFGHTNFHGYNWLWIYGTASAYWYQKFSSSLLLSWGRDTWKLMVLWYQELYTKSRISRGSMQIR